MFQMSQCHKMMSVMQSPFKSTDVPLDWDKHDNISPSLKVAYIALSQVQDLRSLNDLFVLLKFVPAFFWLESTHLQCVT